MSHFKGDDGKFVACPALFKNVSTQFASGPALCFPPYSVSILHPFYIHEVNSNALINSGMCCDFWISGFHVLVKLLYYLQYIYL